MQSPRTAALLRTLSAEVLPESLDERAAIGRSIAEVIRVVPIACAVLLADTRTRHFHKREQAQPFLDWVEACFGREINREYVYHLVAVGVLLDETKEAKWCCTTLRQLPYNVLHVLTQLDRPKELHDWWLEYGATVVGASREEVRGWVDDFLAKQGRKKKRARPVAHLPGRLSTPALFAQFGDCDPRSVLDAADQVPVATGLSMVTHSLVLSERQVELGKLSAADLTTLLTRLRDSLVRLVPAARAAGIEM